MRIQFRTGEELDEFLVLPPVSQLDLMWDTSLVFDHGLLFLADIKFIPEPNSASLLWLGGMTLILLPRTRRLNDKTV